MVRGSSVATTWGKGCVEQKGVVRPVFGWEMGRAFCVCSRLVCFGELGKISLEPQRRGEVC